ncbi:ZIP family metal transporter [Metallumcola ferriviriculae]|uniref:ZIP family metal transporter n=1 Tax=Metallumcola ferriviriculae TaxID=3039180 RepID=A0AAU0UNP4_9FIRM|nr:ZIP family metal transporter [Desulfitibacteraceae bacterium MK1]
MELLILSIFAGLATSLGALVVAVQRNLSERSLAVLLGGAAGIMAGVVILDLLPSAWYQGGLSAVVQGFLFGLLFLFLLDRLFAFTAPAGGRDRDSYYMLNMGYLIAVGIALHDVPEGMAIAVGYAAEAKLGVVLVLAIALHNIPEGMAAAAPLLMGGSSFKRIMLVTGIISMFTPLGTLAGMLLVKISIKTLGEMLAVAAGAMTYIVRFELIPEARMRHPNYALLGIAGGAGISLLLALWHGA